MSHVSSCLLNHTGIVQRIVICTVILKIFEEYFLLFLYLGLCLLFKALAAQGICNYLYFLCNVPPAAAKFFTITLILYSATEINRACLILNKNLSPLPNMEEYTPYVITIHNDLCVVNSSN